MLITTDGRGRAVPFRRPAPPAPPTPGPAPPARPGAPLTIEFNLDDDFDHPPVSTGNGGGHLNGGGGGGGGRPGPESGGDQLHAVFINEAEYVKSGVAFALYHPTVKRVF